MNRNELVEYLRDPSSLSSESLAELEKILSSAPYFQSARMLLAKGSKMHSDPATKKRIASAAIYATDRALLKKYLSGKLLFLTQPPEKAKKKTSTKEATPQKTERKVSEKKPDSNQIDKAAAKDQNVEEQPSKYVKPSIKEQVHVEEEDDGIIMIPGVPTEALDMMLEELEQDMEDLKSSRSKFADMQEKLDDSENAEQTSTEKEEVDSVIAVETEIESKKEEIEVSKEPELEEAETQTESSETDTGSEIEEKSEPVKEEKTSDLSSEDLEEDRIIANKIEEAMAILDQVPDIGESRNPKEKDVEEKEEETPSPALSGDEPNKESTKTSDSDITDDSREEPEATEKEDNPTIMLESDKLRIQREERRERREQRINKLSSLDSLPSQSLKKLEDQMWGDSDDGDKKKSDEENLSEPVKASKKISEEVEKIDTKKSEEKRLVAKKSTDKKAVKTESKTKGTKKTAPKKKSSDKTTAATKKVATSKAAASKKTTAKTTTKKTPSKTAKKSTTSKGTTKKSTTKKTTTKKKDDDDGKSDPQSIQDQIIDKFIKESPSISRAEKAKGKVEDLSVKNSSWDKDLASEHLAEIYLHQGNKKRALEIYTALSLNFPEKKSYFADLISKIK